jgi:hypothetical protein
LLVAGVEAVATGDAVAVAAGAAGTLIPHFLQKEVPGSRVAPQALQKAKVTSRGGTRDATGGVYRKFLTNVGGALMAK